MKLRKPIWCLGAATVTSLFFVSLYFALTSSRDNASGWWQVFLETLGLPVLIYGLYKLREEMRREGWRPEIRIGISQVEPLSEVRKRETLPTMAIVSQGYACFQLIVGNRGRLAARFVKMHLEFLSFQDDSYASAARSPVERLAAPTVKIPNGNPFKWQNNKDFIFEGGHDWVIYPRDDVTFAFFLGTVVQGQLPVPYDYRFRCTVWAEGLDNPVHSELTVRVTA